jgi:hypothetical protein
MDRGTLLNHRALWGQEPDRYDKPLPHLTPAENGVYEDLRFDRFGVRVRLEQERIPFGHVERTLESLLCEGD